MSFDVYLVRADPPDPATVRAAVERHPHFQLNGDGDEWQANYANETTGVYFAIDYGDEAEDDEDVAASAPVVLSVTLNYNRPSFFAHECFEIVGGICHELGLRTLVELDEEPATFDFGSLLAAWEAGNAFAVTVLTEQGAPPPYMERKKALEWWRYMHRKDELDERYQRDGIDIYVPTLMLLHDAQTNGVIRLVAWPQSIPLVLPLLDMVIVQKKLGGRFRSKTEQGLVAAETVLAAIGPYLESVDGDLAVLSPEAAAKVKDAFDAFPLQELDRERFSGVASDGFVDTRGEEV